MAGNNEQKFHRIEEELTSKSDHISSSCCWWAVDITPVVEAQMTGYTYGWWTAGRLTVTVPRSRCPNLRDDYISTSALACMMHISARLPLLTTSLDHSLRRCESDLDHRPHVRYGRNSVQGRERAEGKGREGKGGERASRFDARIDTRALQKSDNGLQLYPTNGSKH